MSIQMPGVEFFLQQEDLLIFIAKSAYLLRNSILFNMENQKRQALKATFFIFIAQLRPPERVI